MSSAPMTNNKVQNQGLLSSSSSSVRIEEEIMKQGIITILNSNTNTNAPSSSSSLRRTLSADMSSKNYLHAKTIADSEKEDDEAAKLEEDEAERERLEIWSSIQRNKKEEQEKSGAFDIWSSLVSLKGKDEISKSMPITPYVHPLVKRSKSCLSGKSLEICTESLGSETGSDALLLSSYSSSSETGDATEQEQDKEQVVVVVVEEEEKEEEEELCNYASVVATKKASASASASPPRAFPPPLPSLSHHQASSSVTHMRSHRDNGRLVLQAVSVPSHNNFSIQRQDGRLVLTFSNHQEEEEEEEEENGDHVEELGEEFFGAFEFGEEEDYYDEGVEEEEEEYFFGTKPQVSSIEHNSVLMGYESVIEKAPLLPSGMTSSVHELALMMNNKNKPIGVVNRNPKWSEKFNEMTNFDDVNVAAQSLPPRPRVARLIPSAPAASFNLNAYEYYWRTKSASSKGTSVNLNQLDQEKLKSKVVVSGDLNKVVSREQQQLLVLRGKNGDYLVHNLKSCKDSRRSFLFWEPYCIATS